MRILASAGLVLASSLAGCAGVRTYPNTHEMNAVVHVRTDSGTLLSRIRVDLDLYMVDAACRATYLGSLKLRDPSVDIGLPLENRVLLAYVFSRSAIVGTEGTTVIEMMLTPQKGYRYEFDVSYLKDGYSATGLAFAAGQAQGRDIEHARLRDCAPRT